jgi:asparagine synthase (glutamine-hydrolysing)
MHSLEIRCPFLDYKLAEYVYNIPQEYKIDGKSGKIILKDILIEIMPKEFVYRRKQGFGAPVASWLQMEKMKVFVKNTLSDNAYIYRFLNKTNVQNLLNLLYENNSGQLTKGSRITNQIWNLLCLELWFKVHAKYHE